MAIWTPDIYTTTWNFASEAHQGQTVPGTKLPYINHIANVTMEVMTAIANTANVANPNLAIQCALLHDTIEDTTVTYESLVVHFGHEVANGVMALTKNENLPDKATKMVDSLARIQQQPHEVWMVKLADRISNLQPPPGFWDKPKIHRYREEAEMIQTSLGAANDYLAQRLTEKIQAYERFC